MVGLLRHLEEHLTERNEWTWAQQRKDEILELDLDCLERIINWRNHNFNRTRKPQTMLIRIEQHSLAVFSNDIALLQTLDTINPANPEALIFTEVDTSIPQGVMTFNKTPKHKYRVYLKGYKAPAGFRDSLHDFIHRYKGTGTEVYPCGALTRWLCASSSSWKMKYVSAGFFLEYDADSTYTLLSLVFDQMISKRFELIKRP